MGLLPVRGKYSWELGWPYWYHPQEIACWMVTMVWSSFWSFIIAGHCFMLIMDSSVCRGMKQRDLLLRRYWRREDDGTYGKFDNELATLTWLGNLHQLTFIYFTTVILYHSVIHQQCRPEKDYIRAWLKSNVCLKHDLKNHFHILTIILSFL